MPLYRNAQPFPDEPIWRWILMVLFAATLVATVLTFAAEPLWGNAALADAAGWSAITTAAAYLFFRWLGAREASRQAAREDQEQDPSS